jgi:aryl-alcohol dehydrogenase-like predicted oxidoreductase
MDTDDVGKRLYTATEAADRLVIDRVMDVARKRNMPAAQVALAWMLQKPVITSPIIGASKMKHLDDAVAALSVTLAAEDIASIEEPYVPHPVGF